MVFGCRHNFQYSQGHFRCSKCRKRAEGNKVGIQVDHNKSYATIVIIGIIIISGIYVYGNYDISLGDIVPVVDNEQGVFKGINDMGKIGEKTFDKISDTIQKTIETIPETKITIPQVELPKYDLPKESTLQELKQIALDDINKYRKEKGVRLLVLGSAKSPQLYSEELLLEGCIHHISVRGEGPMLRYQNNHDRMYLVAENIAGGSGTGWNTPDDEIIQGNYRMMFEDEDSNWGHKDNILDYQHQSVSIGIAYDSQRLVMVQDFESVLPAGYQYDPNSFARMSTDQKSCW